MSLWYGAIKYQKKRRWRPKCFPQIFSISQSNISIHFSILFYKTCRTTKNVKNDVGGQNASRRFLAFHKVISVSISPYSSTKLSFSTDWENLINNGNRTEWSPIRSVIIRVINKIGRLRSGSPICLSQV